MCKLRAYYSSRDLQDGQGNENDHVWAKLHPARVCSSCYRATTLHHNTQLVLINITDHFNRTRANSEASTSGQRVLGVLLGQQQGRVVDISNSFELSYTTVDGVPVIVEEFFTLKAGQYKQVFKDLEAVGWYATAPPAVPGPASDAVRDRAARRGA